MEFKANKPIYFQVADYIAENILLGKWETDKKIPSVRSLASSLEINPNTAMRAFLYLQEKGVIYNKRGIGLFISPDSRDKLIELKKEYFYKEELPGIFRTMEIIGVNLAEIMKKYQSYLKKEEA